jgi:RNA-binding protein YhbY
VRFLPDKERAVEKTVNIGKKGLTSAAHWQIKRPVLALR